jgi:SPP1 gp7 family putative phage head morphogenesis protein
VAIPGGNVNVTLSRFDAESNLRLYLVDVARFDKAFAKDPSFYVGLDGEGGIGKRYANVAEYINTNKAMEASTVYVRPDGYVGFINGRHRYAYLRDVGVTQIPVALDEEAAANAAKAGYLVGQGSTAIVPAAVSSIPSRTTLESIAGNVMIDGATTKTWWSKIAADTSFKFKAAVRQGLMQGETQAQIFKRVNTVVGLAGRNSVALVHTSIMQTMNDATEAVLQKNADVTPTMRHLATLDSSTCVVCGSRDGLEWDTLTKEPVGHNLPYVTPPMHFGCRCKLVGVTKLSKVVKGQRASMFGPVDRKVTFNDFLERQTPAFQNEVLGKGRAELYRSGKLTLRDLVSGTGAPLSLGSLEKKYL